MSHRLTIAAAVAVVLAALVHAAEARAGESREAGPGQAYLRETDASLREMRGGRFHARHRWRVRRVSNICRVANGWRAFPIHRRGGYFDTRPVRCIARPC
jgi:hypothetical protein